MFNLGIEIVMSPRDDNILKEKLIWLSRSHTVDLENFM